MTVMIGKNISHYRILERLGEGGMGVVYKAHDTVLDRTVALKFLSHALTSDPVEKERFYHEAKAAAALTHQNIAVVYEIGEHAGQLFIVMEYVEGRTLREAIRSEHLSIRHVLDIAIQIADGLAAAHERGIVHRDIKPENIIVTPKGQPKITDFGLAKLKGATKLTKTGSTLGTAAYMSPEQARGEDVDQRSDIFSFGVVLYEMLTGHSPFRGEHIAAIQYSIVNEEPAPLARYNEKATDELQHIVSKALEKETEDRYQHVDDLLADLRRERKHLEYARTGYAATAEKLTAAAHPPLEAGGRPSRKWRPARAVTVITIAAVLVAGFFLLRTILFEEALSSERRTVAVISFINQTGDNSYDYLQDAIPNLLITNLEQSKYLRVSTWERLYDLRKQIGKAEAKIIDRETGFDLCRMDQIEAIALGSFTKAGDVFATDVKVLDVRTKQLLKSVSSKGEGVSSILKTQIDELSREISRGIGLSEQKIEAAPMQITESSTTSLDAYNYYLRGRDDFQKYYFEEARRYLERAVSIDTTFAAAHLYLGFTYAALNDQRASTASYQKAARYYQKTPERERLLAASALAATIEGNPEKSLRLMKEVAEKYPKFKWVHLYLGVGYSRENRTSEAIEQYTLALELDPGFGPALNELGYVYTRLGEFDKAIECFQRYAAASPGDANPLDSMGELYVTMGRLDDAIGKYREVLDLKPGFFSSARGLAYISLLRQDGRSALESIDRVISLAPAAGLQGEALWNRAIISYCALGKLRQSLRDLDQAQKLFGEVGDEGWIALTALVRGWIYFDRRETEPSKAAFKRFLDYQAGHARTVQDVSRRSFILGLLALQEGNLSDGRQRLAELDTALAGEVGSVARTLRYYRDFLSAGLLLRQDSVDAVLHVMGRLVPPDVPLFRSENLLWYNVPFARDLAGKACVNAGSIDKAISEYERLVTFDSKSSDRRWILPTTYYTLATLYEQRGLRKEAIGAYERFLSLWKDGDPDLPELKDARSRLRKLQRRPGT